MRIAVLGGRWWLLRRAPRGAGHDVTFLARCAHLEAIREHGLVVTSVTGDFTVESARVTDDVASIGEVDAVLLAVKTWQLAPMLESLPALVGPDTAVVTTQNGVEAPAQVATVSWREAVLPGIANYFAFIDAPGHVTNPAARRGWSSTSGRRCPDRLQRGSPGCGRPWPASGAGSARARGHLGRAVVEDDFRRALRWPRRRP